MQVIGYIVITISPNIFSTHSHGRVNNITIIYFSVQTRLHKSTHRKNFAESHCHVSRKFKKSLRMSTPKLFPRAHWCVSKHARVHASVFTCILVKDGLAVKTRVPSLSVQRSLRGSAIKTIRRAAAVDVCDRTGPGVRRAYETSSQLYGRWCGPLAPRCRISERHVEYNWVTFTWRGALSRFA